MCLYECTLVYVQSCVCACFYPEEFEKDKGSMPNTSSLERELEEEIEKDTEREGGEEEEDEELAGLLGLSSLDISVLQELLIRHMNSKTTLSLCNTLFWRVYTLSWSPVDFRLLIFPSFVSPSLSLYLRLSLSLFLSLFCSLFLFLLLS